MRSPTAVAARDANAERAVETGCGVVVADAQRAQIGRDQTWSLPLNCSAISFSTTRDFDVEQRRERADIDDVLEQLALARLGIFARADVGQRHAEDDDVVAQLRRGDRPRGIVEEIAARLDRGDVRSKVCGFIATIISVPPRAPRWPSPDDADFVPGRQALDVRGEDVARRDRHAHAQNRSREQEIGARRAGAVDVREADDEVVYALDRHACPACAISNVNFCMSHAPVGQRSAQRPQCRQRSSSLTMTRPVLTGSET